MEKIRIGNDIVVLWAIRAEQDGEKVPYDLTGRKLSLYVSNQIESWKVQDFETNGSALRWMFCGKDQKHVGTYTLTLVENEGEEEMHTVDMCNAFRLVPRTCQNEEEENDVIELVTLEFLSDFFVQEPLEKIEVDTELSIESENPVENRVITEKFDEIEKSLEKKADSSTLAKVAKSGSYNDLSNKPTIPTKVSQLTNDKNYASQSQVDDLRTEILGDLEADDAETIKDINVEITELYRQIDTINDAGYIKIGDVQTEIEKLSGSETDGDKVKVTVTTSGGEVNAVGVNETGLNTALAGKANLDESGKILASELPDYILGQVMFGGLIDANNSVIPTGNFSEKYNLSGSSIKIKIDDYEKYEGVYFITTADGTILGQNVQVGDWIISSGSYWEKIDNTDAVASVAGLTGTITASALAKKLAETGDANELALKSELNNKQDKLVSGTNVKTINGNSILGSGNIVIEGGGGGSTVQPDWNAQEGEDGYIKNRTHYVTEIPISTSEYTYLEGIPRRFDSDSGIYYAAKEIHVQYREDDYVGIIKIPANTPLGYDDFNTTPFTVIGDDNGDKFTFSSHSDDGDIFFKVERPNAGTDFRVLIYTPLEETYIPDSILNGGYLYSNGEKVDMRFTRSLLPTGTRIPASANLNTIEFLKIGKYYCSLNADAKTIKNCPVNVAFSMEVFNPLGTNVDDETTSDYTYRLRVLTQYDTGQQYMQFCRTNGTAGSWIYDSWFVTPRVKFALASSKNDGSAAIGANNKGVYIDSTGEIKAMSYTIAKNVPSNAVFTDTDTKVTAVGNHYAPAEDSTQQIDAPSGEVVTGIKRDAAGHVVGVVSAPQTGGGGGTGEGSDNVFITDFTINDLQGLIADPDLSIQADIPRLRDALAEHKVVLVPYDSNEGFRGCGIATGYSEDLLYVNIIFDNGSIHVETNIDAEEIHSREVYQRLDYESVEQCAIGDLDRVAIANGITTTMGYMTYAFPDTISGEEDDVLLSRATVKTINGQGLFVDENSNDIITTYERITTSSSSVELLPNTIIEWPVPIQFQELVLTFGQPPQGYAVEYIARFTVGYDDVQLIVPNNVVWADGVLPAMTKGKTYEISFMDGYATFLEF